MGRWTRELCERRSEDTAEGELCLIYHGMTVNKVQRNWASGMKGGERSIDGAVATNEGVVRRNHIISCLSTHSINGGAKETFRSLLMRTHNVPWTFVHGTYKAHSDVRSSHCSSCVA